MVRLGHHLDARQNKEISVALARGMNDTPHISLSLRTVENLDQSPESEGTRCYSCYRRNVLDNFLERDLDMDLPEQHVVRAVRIGLLLIIALLFLLALYEELIAP